MCSIHHKGRIGKKPYIVGDILNSSSVRTSSNSFQSLTQISKFTRRFIVARKKKKGGREVGPLAIKTRARKKDGKNENAQDIFARLNIFSTSSCERALQKLDVSLFVFVDLFETPSNPIWIAGFLEIFFRVTRETALVKCSF